MKRSHLFNIAVCSFLMTSGSAFSQRTTTPTNVDTIQCNLDQSGRNTFEVLPLLTSNRAAFFSHLWWSGDNDFSFVKAPEHTHARTDGNPNFPQVKMMDITTESYGTGGPPPLTYTFTTDIGNTSPRNVLPHGESIYMQNYRNAVLRDTMYLIVSYVNSTNQQFSGKLKFDVGNHARILDQMFISNGNFLSNGEQWDAGVSECNFQNLAPGKERSILVPVLILQNEEDQLNMRVDLINNNSGTGDPISGQDYFMISATVAHSHDPNMMLQSSEADNQCDYRNGKIHYTVKFQNVGVGPTSYVRVECLLDDKVNMSSIDGIEFPDKYTTHSSGTISGVHNGSSDAIYSIDEVNKKITFEMHNLVLQGTGDPNLVDLELSRDQIEFDILVKNNYVFGPATIARSVIYFDRNDPIRTNQVETVCGDALPIGKGGGFQNIIDIKDVKELPRKEEKQIKRGL